MFTFPQKDILFQANVGNSNALGFMNANGSSFELVPTTDRRLVQPVWSACLEHSARKGYRLAVTEATNKVSQHIFRKLGFTERVRRSHLSYRFDGRSVFASIAEHGGPALMSRSLTW